MTSEAFSCSNSITNGCDFESFHHLIRARLTEPPTTKSSPRTSCKAALFAPSPMNTARMTRESEDAIDLMIALRDVIRASLSGIVLCFVLFTTLDQLGLDLHHHMLFQWVEEHKNHTYDGENSRVNTHDHTYAQ